MNIHIYLHTNVRIYTYIAKKQLFVVTNLERYGIYTTITSVFISEYDT